MVFMDSLDRPHATSDLADTIAQHLRYHPCAIRHVRKVMRHFHASASDVERAINQVAVPLTLQIDPENTRDKILLHFLRYPGDIIDMRWVMRQCQASEEDVQQALETLAVYIGDGGEGVVHASIDKE
jgi:UTP:GlnB (protein PII) uridylyltransferase